MYWHSSGLVSLMKSSMSNLFVIWCAELIVRKFVTWSAKCQMFDDQLCNVWHPIRACFGTMCSHFMQVTVVTVIYYFSYSFPKIHFLTPGRLVPSGLESAPGEWDQLVLLIKAVTTAGVLFFPCCFINFISFLKCPASRDLPSNW